MRDCTSTESCTKPNVLCAYPDCARGEAKNAIKKTPTIEDQSTEITRLKEQLARTERERDQAIEAGALVVAGGSIYTDADDGYRGTAQHYPDIYAHLDGKVEG